MLKTTSPKILAEASSDKLWGTETQLHDNKALDSSKWENPGWLSEMLLKIRDEMT